MMRYADVFRHAIRAGRVAFSDAPPPLTAVRSERAAEPELIDVKQLLQTYTVEELAEAAEQYFVGREDADYLAAKPFAATSEAPTLLIKFAKALQALDLLPDHVVLDFGAGSCWTSRFLTQLGCKVYALDVSPTALRIGRELFARQPVIGPHHSPEFLHFDGRRIPLADASVDRILCFDALHHVPNIAEVIREMARVLREGGRVAFSEPGPRHSIQPQSQWEMQHFKVIENDIVLRDLWAVAAGADFTSLEVSIFDTSPFHVGLETFERYLAADPRVNERVARSARDYLRHHCTFALTRGVASVRDSRRRDGLVGELEVTLDRAAVRSTELFQGLARIKNTSGSRWLPATARVGGVHLGVHLLQPDDTLIDQDFFRALLTTDGRAIEPGEELKVSFRIPAPAPGSYRLEFDLVSEGVCWFATNDATTVRIPIEALPFETIGDPRASELWGERARERQRPDRRIVAWSDSRIVQERYIHPAISGKFDENWLIWVAKRYFPEPAELALTLGCGDGGLERHGLKLGIARRFEAFDASAEAVDIAEQLARAHKVSERTSYVVADLNRHCFEPDRYDGAFASMSMHHIKELEHLLAQVKRGVKPGSLFIMNEYVGPDQFQWTERQLELANHLLRRIPERYRRVASGHVKERVVRQPPVKMNAVDPTEAIRSSEIVPLLGRHFDIIERVDYGGTLVNLVLEEIAANFTDAPEDLAILDMLFEAERGYLRQKTIASDFAVIVARRPTACPGAIALDQPVAADQRLGRA